MKQITREVGKRSVAFLIVAGSLFTVGAADVHAAKVSENVQVSDGVNYLDIRYSDAKTHQAVRIIETNLNDPYTAVDIGLSPKLNRLEKTTTMANYHSREEYQVVGAINASFFHAGTPMNLVSKDNRLVHAGYVFPKSVYVNKPIAFGINKQGHGIIDEYALNLSYTYNGTQYPITSTNKERSEGSTILYTSHFPSETTKTNRAGREIVITTSTKPSLEFGTTVTGTVSEVRISGENNAPIPTNGFVLSEHETEHFKDVQVGDMIELSVDVDSKWKGSSFMLASGPMLVENGKRAVRLNASNAESTARAPRSAVAIDKTGKKVFFVTVDGRQKGYSNGMSLAEFSDYLIQLGADRALNLDGGGSTTMGLRYPTKSKVELVNKPSDIYERNVSAILMAVSTLPKSLFPDVKHDHWAAKQIEALFNRGTITGYADGTFRPDESISRTFIALMLAREYGLDTTNIADPGFKDVSKKDTYYKEIAAVVQAGLFEGKGEGLFGKDDYMTRGQLAVVLQRAYGYENTNQTFFSDINKPNYYAYDAINSLAALGLIDGYPDGTFKADNPVSRAMFSKMLADAEAKR